MTDRQGDELPFGMRPGINDNLVQPSFRDGPPIEPRKRSWLLLVPAALALLVVAVLIGYSVLS